MRYGVRPVTHAGAISCVLAFLGFAFCIIDVAPTAEPLVQSTPNSGSTFYQGGSSYSYQGGAPATASCSGHPVQPGETLSSIASKYDTTSGTLARLNGLSNPNYIRVGQCLKY